MTNFEIIKYLKEEIEKTEKAMELWKEHDCSTMWSMEAEKKRTLIEVLNKIENS